MHTPRCAVTHREDVNYLFLYGSERGCLLCAAVVFASGVRNDRPGLSIAEIVGRRALLQRGRERRAFLVRMTAAAETATGGDFEIILVDDGSTDGTWPIMAAAAAHDQESSPSG